MPNYNEPERGVRYHIWANDRTLNVLRRLDEPPQEAIDLFAHIVASDQLWLQRSGLIEGEQISGTRPEGLDLVSLTRWWDEIRQTWHALLNEDLNLMNEVGYTTTKGDSYANTLGDIISHVVNHGSHHRSHIVRVLREHGEKPPELDMIVFLREPDRS